MKRSEMKKRSSLNSRGSAIIEAVISMLLICLILFGLLQFFYYAAAQMVTDYAAFRAARSESVGFKDSLVTMEGRLKAIAASGKMRIPLDMTDYSNETATSFSSVVEQFRYERLAVIDYMENIRPLAYQYWAPEYNTSPNQKSDEDDKEHKTFWDYQTYWSENSQTHRTELSIKSSNMGNSFTEKAVFTDYPWIMPFRKAFVTDGKIDIKGESKMSRHSAQYLE